MRKELKARGIYHLKVLYSKEKPVDIFVNSLSDSAVELGLHVWVATQDYWSVRWRLTENIKLAFDEQGIEIPFNQLSVHIMEKEK